MGKEFKANLMAEMAKLSWRHEVPERREKYAPVTKHITNDRSRRVVECLCEQQLGRIHNMLDEGTALADVALFQKYALKVIPRVYPSLFVKDLISVQPMPLPTAKVFYKDFLKDPAGTRLDLLANFSRTYANRGTSPVSQPVGVPPPTAVGPTSVTTNEGQAPAMIKMALTSTDVSADSKALQYSFSAELNQDLMAYHGMSADPELGAEAAQEIQREIEYDIIAALITGAAAGNVNWSATPPAGDASKTIDIEAYNRTFFNAVVDARNLVFKKRYTYPNWLICHPDMAVRFEKLSGFEYDPLYSPGDLMQGRQFFGTVRKVISIYVDPWFPDANKAVLGYKGAADFEVGLAYCPYIPFYSTAPFENPATLQTSRALLARQAIAMLVPEMYSTLTITNNS